MYLVLAESNLGRTYSQAEEVQYLEEWGLTDNLVAVQCLAAVNGHCSLEVVEEQSQNAVV